MVAEKKEETAEKAEKTEAVEEKATEKKEDKAKKEEETKADKPKAKTGSKTKKSAVATDLIEGIKNMSVLELSELVKELEETFGVSAAAPVAVAAAAAGGAPAEEEKSVFDVVLASVGDKKIQVIKVVRSLTGLGLKEAKAVVDEAPKPVKEKVNKDEAEKMKKELEDVGATVELK